MVSPARRRAIGLRQAAGSRGRALVVAGRGRHGVSDPSLPAGQSGPRDHDHHGGRRGGRHRRVEPGPRRPRARHWHDIPAVAGPLSRGPPRPGADAHDVPSAHRVRTHHPGPGAHCPWRDCSGWRAGATAAEPGAVGLRRRSGECHLGPDCRCTRHLRAGPDAGLRRWCRRRHRAGSRRGAGRHPGCLAVVGGGARTVRRDLRRRVAAQRPCAAGPHLPAVRRGPGGHDHLAAGGDRWHRQLGLPLHLAARPQSDRAGAVDRRMP